MKQCHQTEREIILQLMYQSTNDLSIILILMQLPSGDIKHVHYQVSILINFSYIPNINVGSKLIKRGVNLIKKSFSRHGLPLPILSLIYINLPKNSTLIYLNNQRTNANPFSFFLFRLIQESGTSTLFICLQEYT